MGIFLTAEWKNLLNITYAVDPSVLESHLPKGLELDIVNGKAHISLVAFDFLQTRVKGIKIPFHVNFPEINLRYYVNYKSMRGVAFLREFVPKHCIAFIARRFYNEPYVSYPMESKTTETETERETEFSIWKEEDHYKVKVISELSPFVPPHDSKEHYFKEHSLGFGKDHEGKTLFYNVEHPEWQLYPIRDLDIKIDFGKLYGPEWEFLNSEKPELRMLAAGSPVKVLTPGSLDEIAK
jgi:uncharacterized protein YqjF (DUF2071 family)